MDIAVIAFRFVAKLRWKPLHVFRSRRWEPLL